MSRLDELLLAGLVILGVFLLGTIGFFMGLGTRARTRALEQAIAHLRAEVMGMSAALQRAGLRPDGSWAGAPPPAPWAAPAQAPAVEPPATVPEPAPPAESIPWHHLAVQEDYERAQAEAQATAAPAPPAPPAPTRSLEEMLALRWGVWLGAAALLLAGVFLIRYAVEEGLLGPAARCILAMLLGFALIGAGEWLARRPLSKRIAALRPDYAPPALTAGGVATLFGAAYGASVLYGLLPPTAGFVLMALVGGLGLVLSIRRGPLVAAVGLVGAFATPALVQTDNPSLPGLFAYLLVITAATMAVVRITAAGWLGWCATVAGAVWVLIGSDIARGMDAWAPALFVPLAAATHLFLLPRAALQDPLGRQLAFIPFAALGLSLLPATATSAQLAWPAGILLLSLVGIARARNETRLAILPFVAAGLGLFALWIWRLPPWKPTGERILVEGETQGMIPGAFAPEAITPFLVLATLLGGAHLLAGLMQERRVARPLPWAALAATVPVLALLLAYARVRGFAIDMGWAFCSLALAGLLTGTAALAAKEGSGERTGIHAAGAMAALALAVAMVLRDQWLTLAISLFVPPLAWLAGRAQLPALRPVAAAVGAVVLVRLLMNRFVAEYDFGTTPVLNGLLVAYALPAMAFAATAWLLRRERDDEYVAAFEGAATLLGVLFVLLEIRHFAQGGVVFGESWSFQEMALHVSALALMALAMRAMGRAWSRPILQIAAMLLAVGALGLGVLLLLLNPWMLGESPGQWPILNLLLAAYALPGLLAAWAVMRAPEVKHSPGWHRLVALYAIAAIFAWVTLEVWRAFHVTPVRITRRVTDAELWAYSGAWLVLGGVIFWLGIRYASRELRLAALAVIGLTTFKVFLVDMGELVGLWRVLSFLGLGLALIGLGAVYQRYVLPRPGATPPSPPAAPNQETRNSS